MTLSKRGETQTEAFGPHGTRGVYLARTPGISGDRDEYVYTKEGSRGLENQQVLEVRHQPPRTTFNYGEDPYGGQHSENSQESLRSQVAGLSSRLSGPMAQARLDYIKPLAEGGQLKLFGQSKTIPASSTVDYLEGTKEARAMTPTMLGIAQNRTLLERGRGLEASTDLSEHSVKLVSHLQEKGVIGGEEPEVSNEMRFRTPITHYPNPGDVKLSHQEVMAGRATGRAALRGGTTDVTRMRYEAAMRASNPDWKPNREREYRDRRLAEANARLFADRGD